MEARNGEKKEGAARVLLQDKLPRGLRVRAYVHRSIDTG
jgi:hypothetical protein